MADDSGTGSAGDVTFKKRKRKATARESTITAIDDAPVKRHKVSDEAAEESERIPPSRDDERDNGGIEGIIPAVVFKTKKAGKENPLVQSTRRRLQKDLDHDVHQSKRTVMPDQSTQDHFITVDVVKDKAEEAQADAAKKKLSKWMGPAKQASNIKVISRFDYQPDVCKDYKETGYCGFGDSCKFMHDRGDYKSGWQLEKEHEAEQKAKAMGMSVGEEEDYRIVEDDFPFACHICREDFNTPIVTKCGHYFCEACALKRFIKDSKCAVCRQQTFGIFNTATKLLPVLARRKEVAAQAAAVAERRGAGDDDDDDGTGAGAGAG